MSISPYRDANGYPIAEHKIVIMQQLALGKSSREIATYLGASKSAINRRIRTLYTHLCVDNTDALLRKAHAQGWISVPIEKSTNPFTKQQTRILQEYAYNRTTEEICSMLSITYLTLRTQVQRMHERLENTEASHYKTRTFLVCNALRRGWIR